VNAPSQTAFAADAILEPPKSIGLVSSLGNYFTQNKGQTAEWIRYYSTGNPSVAFGDDRVMFVLRKTHDRDQRHSQDRWKPSSLTHGLMPGHTADIEMRGYAVTFEDSNRITPEGTGRLPITSNFFIGSDSNAWRTDVPNYDEIIYRDIYNDIDIAYRKTAEGVKYEFRVHKGADLSEISMRYESSELTVSHGDLIIGTPLAMVIDTRPISYQGDSDVHCSFVVRKPLTAGFDCEPYDSSRTLVIDPLIYSTFLGAGEEDLGLALAHDDHGNVILTGKTYSSTFPTTPTANDTMFGGSYDCFIAKIDNDGSDLLFSTFIGGSSGDICHGVALDPFNNVYVTGDTFSADFPVTTGAFNTTFNGACDGFVAKLSSSGSILAYATYIANPNPDFFSIAVDGAGNAYITGATGDPDFPTTPGAFNTTLPGVAASFVVKLNVNGSSVTWGTYLGGSNKTEGRSIAVDTSGNVYITGFTTSSDFPTTPGAFDRNHTSGGRKAYITKLNASGDILLYSTFLGGTKNEYGYSISVDFTGNAYVTGETESSDFPTTPGACDATLNGTTDAFVAQLNAQGNALVYSTYLGGSGFERGYSIAVDINGNAWVTGMTDSTDFPITSDAYQSAFNGGTPYGDVFLTELNSTGSALAYSTFLGGVDNEIGLGVAVDLAGNAYVTGHTFSSDFPTTPGSFDTSYNANGDVLVVKLNPANVTDLPDLAITPPDISLSPDGSVTVGTLVNVAALVHNAGNRDALSVSVRFHDGPPSGSNQIGSDQFIPGIWSYGGVGFASVAWVAGPPGAHVVCVVADPDSRIVEINEDNNQACVPIEVLPLPMPDLSVSPADIILSPDPPHEEGSTVLVNATVRNIGGDISGATTVRFHDGVPPSPAIGIDQPLSSVPVGGQRNVSVVWTPSAPGIHEICVVADPDGMVAEIDETNNMACVSARVLSLPDLTPTSIVTVPPSPLPEDTFSLVNVTVANAGDLSAGGFDVLLFDDSNGNLSPDPSEDIGVQALAGIAGHSQSYAEFAWSASPAGAHSLCAYTDPPPGTVTESNETNNVMCIGVLVQPGPILRPDYVPDSPLPLPPIKVGISRLVSLSVQVVNRGNGTGTDDATVAFYEQSSPPFSTFILNPLAPAATSFRFTAMWISPAIPGTYLLSVDIDYDNNVSEWDETNNVYTWTIEVVAGPITSLVIGAPNYTSTATYVKSSTPLGFSVIDQSGLGIRNTTYRVDSGDWVNYTATGIFFLAGEGEHAVEWRSLDWAGNLEDVSSMALTEDDTPPATTITQSDVQATTETFFNLTAADAGCGVNVTRYRIDGGNWTDYTGRFTLPEGDHNVSYYSNDMLNNTEVERWLVVTVEGTTTPPEVAVNYKPIVALVFAIILAVAGIWSSKRRPWKGGKDRIAVAKAFMMTSLSFVVLEATTGMVSLLTGQLSMPPLVGAGTAVDLAILLAGAVVAILRIVRTKPSGAGETNMPQKR
jgi:subtilase family serine protease